VSVWGLNASQDNFMKNPVPFSCFPPDIQQKLIAAGKSWKQDTAKSRSATLAALDPYLRAAPKDGVIITKNVAYGPHPRQILDMFQPARTEKAPIVVFVHGGAFVRGDKDTNEHVYANVLIWFARQGYLGINMEYRLAPEVTYPGATRDVADVVKWLKQNALKYGGDPERIFLIGHSTGGTHVASYAYDPEPGYLGRDVRGIVLISARLRADVLPENPNAAAVRAYYGADESLHETRSPVMYGASSDMPTFIAIAEYENPLLDVYCAELFYRRSLQRRRTDPFMRLAHHNHISIMAHFNTEDEILGREILNFFNLI